METNLHTLKNGATVIGLSAHGFRFSDGTESKPAPEHLVEALTLAREFLLVKHIKGMQVNRGTLVLSYDQCSLLDEVCAMADIVILPFPVLAAMRDAGIRDRFPNAVSFNATTETRRSPPSEKVIDVDNWSY